MPEYTLQFRGWHCIVAAFLFLGYCSLSTYARIRSVDQGMRDSIREYLLNEYSGRNPSGVERILGEAHNGQTIESLPEVEKHSVEFSSILAVGKYTAEYEMVRIGITVDGGPPPKGGSLRYLRVEHLLSGKWLVVGQSDSFSYYSELFPFL